MAGSTAPEAPASSLTACRGQVAKWRVRHDATVARRAPNAASEPAPRHCTNTRAAVNAAGDTSRTLDAPCTSARTAARA